MLKQHMVKPNSVGQQIGTLAISSHWAGPRRSDRLTCWARMLRNRDLGVGNIFQENGQSFLTSLGSREHKEDGNCSGQGAGKDKTQHAKRKENTMLSVGMLQRSVEGRMHPEGAAESCGMKEKWQLYMTIQSPIQFSP